MEKTTVKNESADKNMSETKSSDVNMSDEERQRIIYGVTLRGSIINMLLLVLKFVAGFVGGSAAMIADAVHSLSDFITDIIVVVFVRLGNKPEDRDHDYGHGKYETLATAIIGISLLFVGAMICYGGAEKVLKAWQGEAPAMPGVIAFVAAVVSIVLKEWAYRFTAAVGKRVQSQAVVANAWHHRSDALSSIGTGIGIGGALLLGDKWTVLDPIAAIIVSFFIMRTAWSLLREALGELLEESLPEATEKEIVDLVLKEHEVSEIHHLRTRRIGNHIAIDMHVRMPGDTSLYDAHRHATDIEQNLRSHFGPNTYINLHVEPLKVNGEYVEPFKGKKVKR